MGCVQMFDVVPSVFTNRIPLAVLILSGGLTARWAMITQVGSQSVTVERYHIKQLTVYSLIFMAEPNPVPKPDSLRFDTPEHILILLD